MTRRLAAEAIGSFFLFAGIVGSGIMGEALAGGNTAVALLANSVATGAILAVLIAMLGPLSGAHFNPAVTLAFLIRREIALPEAAGFVLMQIGGGILGVWAAHFMFDMPVWQLSENARTGSGQWLGEGIATFGLLFTILGTLKVAKAWVPASVAVWLALSGPRRKTRLGELARGRAIGSGMTSTTPRSAFQRLAIILAVVVQIGATFLPQLGYGEPIGDRSDSVRTLITPAGWAFAIWGPLFFGSAFYAIWQALPAQRDNVLLAQIGWPSVLALSMQGVWAIYTQFANLTVISALIIVTSLAALLVILHRLVAFERPFSLAERTIVAITFSALAAWLTAASIVNISASIVYHGVGGSGQFPMITAMIVAVGGVIAAVAVARSRGNPWYALVFAWALFAIYMRGGQENGAIALATLVAGLLVLGAVVVALKAKANRHHWFG
ncbi:aquaporin [Erythrobacter sp. SD-21]|uniref:aquaporin n=1 Tax=Erythrobacter sp. SD-21 TaxID=161528 RepID=UPI0002FEAF90